MHVEYFLTKRGEKMLEAVLIMQQIGIEYMIEHGMEDILYDHEAVALIEGEPVLIKHVPNSFHETGRPNRC